MNAENFLVVYLLCIPPFLIHASDAVPVIAKILVYHDLHIFVKIIDI